jgi:hypothetical protein
MQLVGDSRDKIEILRLGGPGAAFSLSSPKRSNARSGLPRKLVSMLQHAHLSTCKSRISVTSELAPLFFL